ncbi:MAG: DeoR/GlpR transcriptional regulator [Clostridia bacterium]|nr:DeoR/GlpR transcriptional regulator [Clostridia bacterium]
MYGNEREQEIMQILTKSGYATVDYLADKIHISPSSIRRDLKRLEQSGLITRSYGGAELKHSLNRQIPFDLRYHLNTKEKSIVASKAASLVKSEDVIFLDSSTSTYYMIEHLVSLKNITVITNSLTGMTALSQFNINSILIGGHINSENRTCCVGPYTEEFINSLHADYCFFSVQSLTKSGELFDCFSDELVPRKTMLKNAEKKVFLCDSHKLNRHSAYKLCNVSELDYVVSDVEIEEYLDDKYDNITFL